MAYALKPSSLQQQVEDKRIIEEVLAGDVDRFEELVLAYQSKVFSMIVRTVGDKEIARDLTQETFIKAYKALGTFKHESAFSSWLIQIGLNNCKNYFASKRYKQKRSTTELDLQKYRKALQHSDSQPDRELIKKNLRHQIATLNPELQQVVILIALEGYTYKEAAEVLNIPEGTASSRMNKALNELRKIVQRGEQ